MAGVAAQSTNGAGGVVERERVQIEFFLIIDPSNILDYYIYEHILEPCLGRSKQATSGESPQRNDELPGP